MKNTSSKAELVSRFYRGNHCALFTGLAASIMASGIGLIASWFIKAFIDVITKEENALSSKELIIALVLFLIYFLITFILKATSEPEFIRRGMKQYKDYAFEMLTAKGIASFKDEDTSSYLSALTNDCTTIENNYLAQIFNIASKIISFVGTLVLMLIYSPALTGIVIAVMLIPVVISALTGNKMQSAQRTVSDKNSGLTSSLTDCLGGFPVIKSFKAEEEVKKNFSRQNGDLESSKCHYRKLSIIINSIGGFAGLTAQLGVFLAGVFLVNRGYAISAGTVIMFVNLMNFLIQPVSELPALIAGKKAADGLIDKLANMLETGVEQKGEDISDISKGISLKNVSYSYDGDKDVLHDINTEFLPGRSYAIVGGSGSGKSTLLNLLMAGGQTYNGNIKVDDKEIRDISTESLYDLMTVIHQNVFIFNSSIRDNVTMFRDFEDDKVSDALSRAHLKTLIDERGEDYLCGENGKDLSGGEKQRISIARSLLKRSRILLADEATSALDNKTSHDVIDEILDLKDMTRIVVTHSLDEDLLRRYDEILVLKDGRIEEQGTYRELMDNNGYFKALVTVA